LQDSLNVLVTLLGTFVPTAPPRGMQLQGR